MKKLYSGGLKAAMIFAFAMLGFTFSNADSPRFVVMEQFTNTSCQPCADINPQYHAGLEAREDYVIPLVYHWRFPSTADPMYQIDTDMNLGRAAFYNVSGVPSASTNGSATTHPANHVNNSFAAFDNLIGQISPIDLVVTRTNSQATVEVTSSVDLKNHTLHVVVVEDPVDYGQTFPNGERVFPWVPRQMLPTFNGTQLSIDAGKSQTFNFNYSIGRALVSENVHVVAFVQENSSREILQGRADNSVEPAFINVSLDNPYLKTEAGGSTQFTVTIENPNDFEVNVELTPDVSNMLNGFSGTLDQTMVTVGPNSSEMVTGSMSVNPNTPGFAGMSIATSGTGDGKELLAPSLNVYTLSSASKNVYYFNATTTYQKNLQALNSTPWGQETALMGYSDELYEAYGPENFEMAFLITDWSRRGYFGAFEPQIMADYLAAGKDILMMSSLDLYNSYNGTYANATAQGFFSNIGVGSAGFAYVGTINQNGQVTAVNSFNVIGKEGTMFAGLNYSLNRFNQQNNPYFTAAIDKVRIANMAKATTLFDVQVTQPEAHTGPAATGAQVGDSKVFYANFSFDLMANDADRLALVTKIYEWFQDGVIEKGPRISSNMTQVNFGDVPVGTPREMTFMIMNDGDQDLVIQDPGIGFGSDEFMVEEMGDFPITIAAGGSQEFTVTFTPSEAKNFNDDFYFATNVPGTSEFSIVLSGRGVEANDDASIQLSSSMLEFEEVLVETTRELMLTITNNGQANLELSEIALSGADSPYTILNPPTENVVIPFNNSYQITVRFAPTATGTFTNSIQITSNDPSNPMSEVMLSGEGTTTSVDAIVENGFSVRATPNVFSGSTTLSVEVENNISGDLELFLIDAAGNRLVNIYNGVLASQLINLNGETLAAGTYYVVAVTGDNSSAMQVIVE